MSDDLITRMKAAAERAEHGEFWQVAPPYGAPASTADVIHIALSKPGNVLTLIARIEALTARVAELSETFTDEAGTVWMRPTAWAYAQACAALEAHRENTEAVTAERDEARARLARAEEGLRFYANSDDWSEFIMDERSGVFDRNEGSKLGRDLGRTARAALGEQEASDASSPNAR